MKRGKPRTPTANLKLHGGLDKRARDRRAGEPVVSGVPKKPSGLDACASAFWDEFAPRLIHEYGAAYCDGPKLAGMCIWWSEFQKARKHKGNEFRRITMMACAWKQFDKIAGLFGLSPSERAGLQLRDHEEYDPAAEFIA